MTTEAGSGVEGHVAKRLGFGRGNHLPDVDAHSSIDNLQLVHQGNVDPSEDVLEEFSGLSRTARGHGDQDFYGKSVEFSGLV